MRASCAAFLAAFLLAAPAAAQELRLPGNATQQTTETIADDSYNIATGPWIDGAVPTTSAEGTVTQTVWRIAAAGITTLQVLRPLRAQLADAGYDILLDCETEACGGFDFRFGIAVLPPPDMQVDLGDYRYLSASKTDDDGAHFAAILVSRTARAGYVQIATVVPIAAAAPVVRATGTGLRSTATVSTMGSATAAMPMDQSLELTGRAVLHDLTFETGSATLAAGPYASLQELAIYLNANTDLTVALVGHTDASGSLEGNISLSKRRAGSVLERLVSDHGIPRRQLEAQGMGYLSPIANNRTTEGRDANRRVEVIITSTE